MTPQLLISLYRRGFSPVWLLTGEGEIMASGKVSGEKPGIVTPEITGNVEVIGYDANFGSTLREMIKKAEQYSAAAGDILKAIQDKAPGEPQDK